MKIKKTLSFLTAFVILLSCMCGYTAGAAQYEVIVDYCDSFDKALGYEGLAVETQNSDTLKDTARFMKSLNAKEKDAYIIYRVSAISEFFAEYTYGSGSAQRNTNCISFWVSPNGRNWTEVTAQDELYVTYVSSELVRTRAYFGNIDTANRYLKIVIDHKSAETYYTPNINTVQINGLTADVLGRLGMYNSSLAPQTVYVDGENGDDKNDGLTEATAFKTLSAVSEKSYSAGSKILLKADCEYSGNLVINGTGNADNPITLSAYGTGAKPVINALGGSAVTYYGEYINISGIKITNVTGSKGVEITVGKPGANSGYRITDCDFENINTDFNYTLQSDASINLINPSRLPTWFENVEVSGNTFKRVARSGIVISNYWAAKDITQTFYNKNDISAGEWFGHKNVVIRGNRLDNVGGDGILIFGCEGALIEYNTVANSALLAETPSVIQHFVPVWCHSSNNCVFQYNEVYGTRSTNNAQDLQAFDCDVANKDCIFQYNYSHDNEGGFLLICAGDRTLSPGVQTTGTIVRYNVSVNDGTENGGVFVIDGSVYDSQIYNNTVYQGAYNAEFVKFVHYVAGNDYSRETEFYNNIFYADNGKNTLFGDKGNERLENATFENNVFYNINTAEITNGKISIGKVISEKPELSAVGFAGNGRAAAAESYRPLTGYVLSSGTVKQGTGGKDMLGGEIRPEVMGALAPVGYKGEAKTVLSLDFEDGENLGSKNERLTVVNELNDTHSKCLKVSPCDDESNVNWSVYVNLEAGVKYQIKYSIYSNEPSADVWPWHSLFINDTTDYFNTLFSDKWGKSLHGNQQKWLTEIAEYTPDVSGDCKLTLSFNNYSFYIDDFTVRRADEAYPYSETAEDGLNIATDFSRLDSGTADYLTVGRDMYNTYFNYEYDESINKNVAVVKINPSAADKNKMVKIACLLKSNTAYRLTVRYKSTEVLAIAYRDNEYGPAKENCYLYSCSDYSTLTREFTTEKSGYLYIGAPQDVPQATLNISELILREINCEDNQVYDFDGNIPEEISDYRTETVINKDGTFSEAMSFNTESLPYGNRLETRIKLDYLLKSGSVYRLSYDYRGDALLQILPYTEQSSEEIMFSADKTVSVTQSRRLSADNTGSYSVYFMADFDTQDICFRVLSGKDSEKRVCGEFFIENIRFERINVINGDLDGSGDFGAVDLAALRKVLLGINESEIIDWAADANSNGKTDICDLIHLKKILLKETKSEK